MAKPIPSTSFDTERERKGDKTKEYPLKGEEVLYDFRCLFPIFDLFKS